MRMMSLQMTDEDYRTISEVVMRRCGEGTPIPQNKGDLYARALAAICSDNVRYQGMIRGLLLEIANIREQLAVIPNPSKRS